MNPPRLLDALLMATSIAAVAFLVQAQFVIVDGAAPEPQRQPITAYNAVVDWRGPDLGDVPTPGWRRCTTLNGASTDPRWPRIHPRTGERIAGGMAHLMSREQREAYLAAVKDWAKGLPEDVDAVVVNVDESVTLPIGQSRDHIVSQIEFGGEKVAESAFADLCRRVIETIRAARPNAKIGWFLQARWTGRQTVAAMAPIFRELDWIGVTLYLTRDPRTDFWRKHLTQRLQRVADAAPEGVEVWRVIQGQFHGAARVDLRQRAVPVGATAMLLGLAPGTPGADSVVVWGHETIAKPVEFREAVRGLMNAHEAVEGVE